MTDFTTKAALVAHYRQITRNMSQAAKLYQERKLVLKLPPPTPVVVYEAPKPLYTSLRDAIMTCIDLEGAGIIPFDTIVAAVCTASEIIKPHLFSSRRTHEYASARQVLYWLAKHHTKMSLTGIGRCISGRDHATILHGIRMVDKHPALYEPLLSRVQALLGV